jgi:exodeoxyribonuclease V gamma subunit
MFSLYSANTPENLLAELITVIETQPLSSPFSQDVFFIQSAGMERWISQQLARHFKVWSNCRFLVANLFFNALAQAVNSNLKTALFDHNSLLWCIESLLRGELNEPEFAPVVQYLAGDNSCLKRYQLAEKLAQLFDQYQLSRPDMMSAWRQDQLLYATEAERWQKTLWLRLSVQLDAHDKTLSWRNAINALKQSSPGSLSRHLPERIFVFGVHQLAPVMLDFLHGLARHCTVHFFLLTPLPAISVYKHALLSRLGQQANEFQQLLAEHGLLTEAIDCSSHIEQPKTVLQHLQNALLANTTPRQSLLKDDSISLHACHSRMREVEVLRNQLLNALECDATLELRDIIVMSPDIQHYVPFISAVFHDIQHTIADCNQLATNQALNALIDFLQISQSRFGWQGIIDLLERPSVYPSFDLAEDDLELIKYWLHDMRVRWGQSAEHRQALGLYACAENTWQAMLDRLLMGYAIGDEAEFVEGILPYKDIEGSSAQVLGGLHDFIHLLFSASTQLKFAMPLAEWGVVLYDYADQLLLAADPIERQQLNDLLMQLSATSADVHADTVDLQVLILWLQDQARAMPQSHSDQGFLRGHLTFCSLEPLRMIPFKVIALLGMNEGEFPRIDQRPSFDLICQENRIGDSSKRSADRYLFLGILLSVRQHLFISYVGQSIVHNTPIAPAIVVSELLEVLRDDYQLVDLTIYHRLHGFSAHYFKASTDLFSYSVTDCATARALLQPKWQADLWWQGVLAASDDDVIELDDVFRFFQHPQRYFLRRQLDLRLYGIEAEPEEREAFVLNNLDSYFSLQHGIQEGLQGRAVAIDKLQAQGRWLSGVMADVEAERQAHIIDGFVARINALELGEKCPDISVDISVGDYRVIGLLGNVYQYGSLLYRYTALKGKDFLMAVLHHLVLNQLQPQATYLLSADDTIILLPEHCQDDYLIALLDSYRQGQQQPDVFFVESCLAYLQQANKSANAMGQALEKAKAQLAKSIEQSHELELKRLYVSVADLNELLDIGLFEQTCQKVLLPLWQAGHGNE